MKHLHSTLIALLISSAFYAQVPSYVPTDGLVGWWPFNGNAQDESGSGHDLIVNGASLTTDRFGSPFGSYFFDGDGDYLNGGTHPDFELAGNRTISVWVRPLPALHPNEDLGIVAYKRTTGFGTSGHFGYALLQRRYNEPTPGYFAGYENAGAPNYDLTLSDNLAELGTWCHIVFERQDGVSRLWVNGVLQSASVEFAPTFSNSMFLVGWYGYDGGSYHGYQGGGYFHGDIDDIGLWNRALNADEIQSLYNAQPALCVSSVPVSFSGLDSDYLTSDGPVTLSGSPTGGVFVGPGINGVTFDPSSAGEGIHGITYMYADAQGCLNASSQCASVSIGMGVEPGDRRLSHIHVFPNPNRGQFTVEFELTGLVSMQLFDPRGALAHTEVLQASGARTIRQIDLSRLAPGIYTLQVQDANGNSQQQVVIH